MPKVTIKTLHFIEDSDDEIFLARLMLEIENVHLVIVHHVNLGAFIDWNQSGANKDVEPMLILVDMNMPLQKGDTAIRQILMDQRFSDAMIGMCSGSEDPADKRDAFAAGAQFFVQKPLNLLCLEKITQIIEPLSLKHAEGITLEYELK